MPESSRQAGIARSKRSGVKEGLSHVSQAPEGYRDVAEADRIKAKVFFDRGKTVAGTGNFDYAIEMYLQGLSLDPDAIEAHQALRDIAMKRKASGGKAMGMLDAMKMKRPQSDDKVNMLNAEKLLSYDPGKTDHMQSLIQSALRAGYYDTVMWMGPLFQKANADDKKPEFSKFIVLKDVYKQLKQWRLAADACQYALRMKPDDMDLSTELKNLGATETMTNAGYEKGGSFRDQIRDRDKQKLLMDGDKDYQDEDAMAGIVRNAEAQYKADPSDPSKLTKYIDALEKTEIPEQEAKAIELLQDLYDRTKQYRFRQRIGQIQMRQLNRMERGKREAVTKDPNNPEVRKDYIDFKREQIEFELKEFQLAADAYPTDLSLRYQVGRRLFQLGRFSDAIPWFQQARQDPKYRNEAGMRLGQAFFEAHFFDEAADTLVEIIKDYPNTGDDRFKELHYWAGRTFEAKGMKAEAIQHYSKVAQVDFNYRDVQARIKKLRT
jgi:Tfp pilus assembly protein PilF